MQVQARHKKFKVRVYLKLLSGSHKVDTLTENGAVFKGAQNTFDKMWRKLPDTLGV